MPRYRPHDREQAGRRRRAGLADDDAHGAHRHTRAKQGEPPLGDRNVDAPAGLFQSDGVRVDPARSVVRSPGKPHPHPAAPSARARAPEHEQPRSLAGGDPARGDSPGASRGAARRKRGPLPDTRAPGDGAGGPAHRRVPQRAAHPGSALAPARPQSARRPRPHTTQGPCLASCASLAQRYQTPPGWPRGSEYAASSARPTAKVRRALWRARLSRSTRRWCARSA